MNKAQEALDRKQYRRAIHLFSEELIKDSQNADAYYGLGHAYYLMNRLLEAESNTAKAIEINPSFPGPYRLMFCIRRKQGADKSILYQLAEKAYAIAPNDPGALNNFGLANLEIGNKDAARQFLEKAIQIDPRNYLYHLNLCNSYFQLKMKDFTFREARDAYRLHPSLQTGYSLFASFINLERPSAKIVRAFFVILFEAAFFTGIFSMYIWKCSWLVVIPIVGLLLLLASGINSLRSKAIFKGVVRIVSSLVLVAIFIYLAITLARW
jgi:tetratricopeptide (TPR) repeat protein